MPAETTPGSLNEKVLRDERERLAARRNAAGFRLPQKNEDAGQEDCEYQAGDLRDDTVGLAISGGGIRSASFGLGIVQAFYERGLLRYCDYLSTVSGGSYVGAFLTSLAHHRHSSMFWRPAGDKFGNASAKGPADRHQGNGQAHQSATADEATRRVTFERDRLRRQSPYVQRLIYGGAYLNRPLLFVNNWLPGFLLITIVAVSSLVAFGAMAAWLFRLMFRQDASRVLSALGFGDDLSQTFFPAAVMFVAWASFLLFRSVLAFFRGTPVSTPTAKGFTLALIVVSILCAVSLFGIGDISTKALFNWLGLEISSETKEHLKTLAQWSFYTLVVVGIIPYLTPERLLRSGTTNNPRFGERAVFQIATSALFWGCPLAVFALLARENISCYNNWRPDRYRLTQVTVKDWEEFWGKIKAGHLTVQSRNAEAKRLAQAKPSEGLWRSFLTVQTGKSEENRLALAKPSQGLWRSLNGDEEGDRSNYDHAGTPPMPALPPFLSDLINKKPPPHPIPPEKIDAVALLDNIAADELRQKEQQDGHISWAQRWGSAFLWLLGSQENNVFEDLIISDWNSACERELAVAYFNYLLLDPGFSDHFKEAVDRFAADKDVKPEYWNGSLGFAGKPADITAAYQRAQDARAAIEASPSSEPTSTPPGPDSASEKSFLNKLRALRLADAVYTYNLAQHRERYERRQDWLEEKKSIREYVEHPEKLMDESVQEQEERVAVLNEHVKDLEKAHFQLLQAFYGPVIRPPETVFAAVVTDEDQKIRLWITLIAALVFLVTSVLMNLNQTTMHGFYRDQLASVWLVKSNRTDNIPLADLKSSSRGAPYLLVNCAMSILQKSKDDDEPTEAFVLSSAACGSERFGYADTKEFDGGQFTLADAMAISGAAVTPAVSRNIAVRALLWLLNFRLGQWLPNPAVSALRQPPLFYRRIWRRPQLLHLLLSHVLVPERERDFLFVSDGGLHENLGVETLLLRRCRLIIAVDSGADPKGQFEDLVKLLLRIRIRHGIEIIGLGDKDPPLPLAELCSPAQGAVEIAAGAPTAAADKKGAPPGTASSETMTPRRSHFLLAKIRYPEDEKENPAYFLYIRPSFAGGEWEELNRYRVQNEQFPNDSTMDQIYEPARFEAYRLLGEYIGKKVSTKLWGENFKGDRSYQSLFNAVKKLAKELQTQAESHVPDAERLVKDWEEIIQGCLSEDEAVRTAAHDALDQFMEQLDSFDPKKATKLRQKAKKKFFAKKKK